MRSKAISYTAFSLSNALNQSRRYIGPVQMHYLPFVTQFLGAEKTGEAMSVNDLQKVATQ